MMTTMHVESEGRGWAWFRKLMWSGALFLLLLPAVAMRFTNEVHWTGSDFAFAAVLLFGAAGLVELAARSHASRAYRSGIVAAVGVSFLTIWANGAVGMIGNEDNPYNLWFIGVIALALTGAIAARFRAGGMARAMIAAAAAQAIAAGIGMSMDPRGGIFSALFVLPWLLSAALFSSAARED
jgi:hypothetical protein